VPQLEHELEVALSLGAQGGAIAYQLQREGVETDAKADGSPVTVADQRLNALIVAGLRDAFPDDAILAEESGDDPRRGTAERCWYVDPVDGTRDFATGDANWAIHIGLCRHGLPVLGIVAEPAHHRVSWGVHTPEESGAWSRDESGVRALKRGPSTRRRVVTSKSHRDEQLESIVAALDAEEQIRKSSVGCKAVTLARAEAEIYAHPGVGTKLWDSCAPAALLLGAGGIMTDLGGQALDYRGKIGHDRGLLATLGVDHQDTVDRLSKVVTTWYG
jgi:3'(2'), 5'-bisphosphate nucleotidase